MGQSVRFRLHVSEPFDFERQNGTDDMFGSTLDHLDSDNDEWMIDLEQWFRFNDFDYDVALVGPRYVHEHLARVFDALVGIPVRIAHRTPDGWHYAMTGMLSLAPPEDTQDSWPQAGQDKDEL